jgi:hypothetical protein
MLRTVPHEGKHYVVTTYHKEGEKYFMVKYYVKIDGRVFEFTEGESAMEFAESALFTITKKSWETEAPDIEIRLALEEEEPVLEEESEDLEELEKECEA